MGVIFLEIIVPLAITIFLAYKLGMIQKIATIFKQKKYTQLFYSIGLKTLNNEYPIWLCEDETEYLKILAFQSRVPVKDWVIKKSHIETFLNAKISKIHNHHENNNIVYVEVIKKDLPQTLDWSDDEPYAFDEVDILSLGISYDGLVGIDLNKNAHAFIAGETGSGKSNILKGLIYQSIVKFYDVILIDFKRGVSFSTFDKHIKIYSEHEESKIILEKLVAETNARYDYFRKKRVEDLRAFNNLGGRQMCRIIVFIDELAELIKTSDKEATKSIMNSLETLTRLSRGAGISLIMGIQRPDSTVITGQIKNNVSFRVCGRFVDPEPSRIMLGNDMATKIPNKKGRFIIKDDDYTEFQAFRFTDEILDMDSLLPNEPIQAEKPQEAPKPKEQQKNYQPISKEPPQETQRVQEPKRVQNIEFNFDNIKL